MSIVRAHYVLLLMAVSLAALGICALPGALAAPPAAGDWVVGATESYSNQTIVIEGNVYIRSPGALTLSNVTLEINSTVAARRGIVVESGASLTTRDVDGLVATSGDRTVIRPLNVGERITFVADAGSTVNLLQTAIWGVGYTQSPINASAVYLNTTSLAMNNLTVYSSYFGLYFAMNYGLGRGNFQNIAVHNNTYNGIEVPSGATIVIDGLLAADNGGAGVHVPGGNFIANFSDLLNNDIGLAVKFNGSARLRSFDASGNSNNLLAFNMGRLTLIGGRSTNASTAGLDARLNSVVDATGVLFADNPTGLYEATASQFTASSTDFVRGIRAIQLRTGAFVSLSDLSIRNQTGSALDFDSASGDFFRVTIDGTAFAGTVTGGIGFVFLDSTLSNSSGGGILFTNASGVILSNPSILNNKGLAIDLEGTTNALVGATGEARIVGSVIEVLQLNVLGSLHIENSTLHAVAARSWAVGGSFNATNGSIVGDVAGASLTISNGAAVRIRGLTAVGFDLRLDAAAGPSDVDGLTATGSAELAAVNGTYAWANVTQSGSGRLRAALGNLSVTAGTASNVRADSGGRLDLFDVSANLANATVVGSGLVRAWWTTDVQTQWQASVAAGLQPFTLRDAANVTVASGTTDGAGRAPVGFLLALTAASSGLTASNPHRLSAGSSSWAATAFYNLTGPSTLVITLNDVGLPSVVIAAPANGSRINANPVVINGTSSDLESGILNIAWSYDNASFAPANLSDPFAIPVPAPFETTYTIYVRVTDKAGNAAVASVTYRVDRTPPNIVLTTPANDSYLRGPTVRFTGGTEPGSAFTIGGTPVPLAPNGDFDINLTLPDGTQTITLWATDGAGNSGGGGVVVHVDSVPPAVAVDSPANGSTVSALTVTLTGRVEPGALLYVNNASQIVAANGSYSALVDLFVDGPQSFFLRAIDAAGNINTLNWTLIRDTRAPNITVAGLVGSGPFTINSTRPSFNITTNEFAVIVASLTPGNATDTASGLLLLFSPAVTQGTATLTVRATDAAGNSRAITYSLNIDVTPPNFTLDGRSEGGAVNENPWLITVTTEPGSNVTINGVSAYPVAAGGTAFGAPINLTTGPNVVVIVVVDSAGNRATRTITIRLDMTPPSLDIVGPPDGVSTGDKQITVSGTTEPGATLTVSGAPVTVAPTGQWSAVVQLLSGKNTIVVTATDAAGNSASETRTVTRTGAASSLTGISFIDQNGWFLLLLLIALAIIGMMASSGRARRRALADKSAAVERDMEAARAMRNDLSALENFQPRNVNDPDFVSAEDFRRKIAQQEGEKLAHRELRGTKKP